MQTRFFSFPDMQASFQLAYEAGLTTPDENGEPRLVAYTDEYAIDVVGVIQVPTGETIDEVPVMEALPGWHVNVRILSGEPLPDSFAQYEVFPVTPTRDFAK